MDLNGFQWKNLGISMDFNRFHDGIIMIGRGSCGGEICPFPRSRAQLLELLELRWKERELREDWDHRCPKLPLVDEGV